MKTKVVVALALVAGLVAGHFLGSHKYQVGFHDGYERGLGAAANAHEDGKAPETLLAEYIESSTTVTDIDHLTPETKKAIDDIMKRAE